MSESKTKNTPPRTASGPHRPLNPPQDPATDASDSAAVGQPEGWLAGLRQLWREQQQRRQPRGVR
jgi:hypothetical protein